MDDKTIKSDALTLICPTCSARYAMPPYVEGQKYGCRKCGASLFFGKFAILQELGRGGFGVVYKAWQADLERIVALKFLQGDSDESTERFIREARIAANLNHPNITAIYEVGKHEGKLYITMQFVDGTTTNKLQLNPREAAEVVRDAALAVDYAHAQKVIHRDIKPHNIMVTLEKSGTHPGGTVRRVFVMDFGLARSTSKESSLTTEGQIMGTPSFMSPEQAEARAADIRSDVYCLGATLYALAVRRPPFEAPTPLQVLMLVAKGRTVPPSKANPAIDPDLESIILKAMALDPGDRYPTAARFAQDLARWIEGEVPDSGHTLRPESRVPAPGAGRRRSSALAIAATAAFAAAGLGVAAFVALGKGTPAPAAAPAAAVALRLESEPSGATVRIRGGAGEWTTPADVLSSSLSGETQTLIYSKDGYLERTRDVRPTPGRPLLVFEKLDPVPTPGDPSPASFAPRPVLEVRSDPPGAWVRLRGRPGGWTTPSTLTDRDAPPGEYDLELTLPGYEPLGERVQVTLERGLFSRSLKKMQRQVAFTVTSDPPGARVFLDGVDTGTATPTAVFRDQVRGAVAQVELQLEGYVPQARSPEIKAEPQEVHVRLAPRTGSFVVSGVVPGATLRLLSIPKEARRPRSLAGLWSETPEGLAQALGTLDAADAAFAVERLRELAKRPETSVRDRAAALARTPAAPAGVLLEGTTTADAVGNAVFEGARVTRRYYLLATSPQARDFVSDELQPIDRQGVAVRAVMSALASVRVGVRPDLGQFEVVLGDGTIAGRLSAGDPAIRIPAGPYLLRYRPSGNDPLLCGFTVNRRTGDPDLAGNLYALCGEAFERDRELGLAARAWQKALEEKTYPASEEAARSRLPERIRAAYRAWLEGRRASPLGEAAARRLAEARAKGPSEAVLGELMDVALAPDAPAELRGEAAGALAGQLARMGRPYEAMEWLERAAALGRDPGMETEARVQSAARGYPGLEPRTAEAGRRLEALRKPPPTLPGPSPAGAAGRVGTVQLANAQIGIWVNLEERAEVPEGTALLVVRDGAVVAELLAGATLAPDETYRNGALKCTRVKGELPRKGDEVRLARK